MITSKIGCLSGNTLKIIGCIAMLIDHLGFMVFPEFLILRVIGRIAYPIFAFMLAEGCYYTKNKLKHLYIISLFGIIFQLVYYLFMKSIDLSIFLIFSISILLIYLFDYVVKMFNEKKYFLGSFLLLSFIAFIFLVYYIDINYYYLEYNYGFFGVMIPVVIYIFRKYLTQNINILNLLQMALILLMVIFQYKLMNLFMLMGLLLLELYNGSKGDKNLKYFFYLFYPLHIVFTYILYLII